MVLRQVLLASVRRSLRTAQTRDALAAAPRRRPRRARNSIGRVPDRARRGRLLRGVQGVEGGGPLQRLERGVRALEAQLCQRFPRRPAHEGHVGGVRLPPRVPGADVHARRRVALRHPEREPAEGLEVEIVKGHDRYRDEQNALKLTTDEDGQISFTLDEAGRYWLETGTEGKTMLDGAEINARNGFVVTFEALAF